MTFAHKYRKKLHMDDLKDSIIIQVTKTVNKALFQPWIAQ